MPPETANEISLARIGDTVNAEAEFSLSRTAMTERPMPDRLNIVTRNRTNPSAARLMKYNALLLLTTSHGPKLRCVVSLAVPLPCFNFLTLNNQNVHNS